MEKISLNLESSNGVVTVLQGEAPKPHNIEKLYYVGYLLAPLDYLRTKMMAEINQGNSVFVINTEKIEISLFSKINLPDETRVIGKSEISIEICMLRINKPDGGFENMLEIYKVFKKLGYLFASVEDHKAFLQKLLNFNIKVQNIYNNADTLKGKVDKGHNFEVTGLPEVSILLNLPIFAGQTSTSAVVVELEVGERNGKPEYFLVSYELDRIVQEAKKEIFNMVSEFAFDNNIPVIYQ
jgi:hypothetical protein